MKRKCFQLLLLSFTLYLLFGSHNDFINALHSRLPHLSKETLIWRLHFVMGALVFGIRQPASLLALSGGRCNPDDLEATFNQILPYAVAGFRAPEPARKQSRKNQPETKDSEITNRNGRLRQQVIPWCYFTVVPPINRIDTWRVH